MIMLHPPQLVALVDLLFMVATVPSEVYLTTAGLDLLNRLRLHKPSEEAALLVALMMLLGVDHTKDNSRTVPNKAVNKVAVTI